MTRPQPGRRTGVRRAVGPAKPRVSKLGGVRRRRKSTRLRTLIVIGLALAVPAATWFLYDHTQSSAARPGLPRVDEAASGMLRIAWNPVALADHYEISVKSADSGDHISTVKSSDPAAQLADLTPNTKYRIRVRAAVQSGKSTELTRYSPVTTASTAPDNRPRLLVPQSLRAENSDQTAIHLTWDKTTGSTDYDVQYSTDPDFKKPNNKTTTKAKIDLELLDANVEWHFRVRAKGKDSARSRWATPVTLATLLPDQPRPLRVASYNIQCHGCRGTVPWSQRRAKVGELIDSVRPDVVGLQEALQSVPRGFRVPQFADLVKVLNGLGGDYAVTNPAVGASKGERIIYRTSHLALLDTGAIRFATQRKGSTSRYVVWAKFRQRATGEDFFFFSTHLEPLSYPVRIAQARQMAASIKRIAGKTPAFAVGDFNASQFRYYAIHRAMTSIGMVDPIGVQASSRTPSSNAPVENRIHTNYDSFNDGRRRPHQGTSNSKGNGSYIDYIFTTPMRVLEYENVMILDSRGRFIGTIPSDHNMLRADVLLPDGSP